MRRNRNRKGGSGIAPYLPTTVVSTPFSHEYNRYTDPTSLNNKMEKVPRWKENVPDDYEFSPGDTTFPIEAFLGRDDLNRADYFLRHMISPFEKKSLQDYANNAFTSINRSLKGYMNPTSYQVLFDIQRLDDIFSKMPKLSKRLRVYRGVPNLNVQLEAMSNSYLSTSLDKKLATQFATEKGRPYILEIIVEPGTPVLPMRTIGHSREREILLPRSGELEIIGHRLETLDGKEVEIISMSFSMFALNPLKVPTAQYQAIPLVDKFYGTTDRFSTFTDQQMKKWYNPDLKNPYDKKWFTNGNND